MVSFNVYRSTASGAYVEGVCLATDEKPVVGIANGSILFAVDTTSGETTRYMYDQNSMSWIEAACPCGGGSGGSGSGGSGSGSGGSGEGSLIVNLTPVSDTEARADKTWGEIQTAFDSGRPVFMNLQQSGHCPVYFCANQNGAYGLRYFVYSAASFAKANVLLVNEDVTADDYPVLTSGGGGGNG